MGRQTPASPTQQKRWDARRGVRLGLVVLLVLLAIYAGYELSHDLPNPSWGTLWPMYSYTPEQGPPSASLLETRPDAIVAQFLTDYIHVAGTFPCIASLADYQRDADPRSNDPALNGKGQACRVHRPVADVRITLVEMIGHLKSIPGIWQPEARVHYLLRYSNGEHLDGVLSLLLFPSHMRSQPYYLTYIHDNCWFLFESWGYFYPHQVQRVPTGLLYVDGTQHHCSGYD